MVEKEDMKLELADSATLTKVGTPKRHHSEQSRAPDMREGSAYSES